MGFWIFEFSGVALKTLPAGQLELLERLRAFFRNGLVTTGLRDYRIWAWTLWDASLNDCV